MNLGRIEEREELPSDLHANYNNEFRVATDGIYYGPTVGMEHMLRFSKFPLLAMGVGGTTPAAWAHLFNRGNPNAK